MKFNKILQNIKPSASMKIGLAENMEAFTNLAVGTPDIAPPDAILPILADTLSKGKFEYVATRGTKKALQNCSSLLLNNIPESELMLVNGAKYGIYLTLKTICNSGDSVILMEPYWLSYPDICYSLELKPVSWIPKVNAKGGLLFDLIKLEELLKSSKATALLLNNPNNPSGHIFSDEFIRSAQNICSKYNCSLIIDEVYKDLLFNLSEKIHVALKGANIYKVGSLSKSISLPGLRIGYISGNKEFIDNANLFNQHIQTCINSFANGVAENISAETYKKHTEHCSKVYQERYKVVNELLSNSNLSILHSEASFYTLINFSYYFPTGEEACDYLANKLNILATPGRSYGESFASYVRFCLTIPKDKLAETIKIIITDLDKK